jgi:ribosomal protein S18 acetylase RimI-like enzyme
VADARRRVLDRIEVYYDAVPRTAARVEDWPPLRLFVHAGPGWPYYARPMPGETAVSAADVTRVRERQRALGIPEACEWVAETTPSLHAAAERAGLAVQSHPLLVLRVEERSRPPIPEGVQVRLATAEDDLALWQAVAATGFGAPGTAVGPAGTDALRAGAAPPAGRLDFLRERVRAGHTVMAAAFAEGMPVAVGSHQPMGGVTEVVGVATLPAFRRRGLAAAVVDALVEQALDHGVATVFLSAGDAAIARIYERLGFRRLGSACSAEPAPSAGPP